jgi:uncharacterized membrane protein YdjX (TVP38/TMEM64 family)
MTGMGRAESSRQAGSAGFSHSSASEKASYRTPQVCKNSLGIAVLLPDGDFMMTDEIGPGPSFVKGTFFREHGQKVAALVFWLILIGAYQWYAHANDLTPLEVIQNLLTFLTRGIWGPLVYILLYAVRPLILFPSTLLTLAGGFVFGPVLGVLYTIIASNISSTIAFFVGRFFGEGLLKDDGSDSLIQRYARRMRENSFETVMVMRFIFLPYDAVSYLAGFLRIKFWPFIFATALGSIPGTIAFIGFGASIESFNGVLPKLNPVTLGISVVIFIISIVLSRLFKKREGIAK